MIIERSGHVNAAAFVETQDPGTSHALRATASILILNACLFLGTCSEGPDLLGQVQATGELRVVTRNSPTTYYIGAEGPLGPEYELARGFARSLGVRLEISVADGLGDILPALNDRRVDLAAAGLTVTPARRATMAFGPPYQAVEQYVIYRVGSAKPRKPAALVGARIQVMDDSSHEESLRRMQRAFPALDFDEDPDVEPDELMHRVATGQIDYTIVDSNEFDISRWFHPEARIGFILDETDELAWAFRRGYDDSLRDAASAYFAGLEADGTLAALKNRYYGRARNARFDYVGTRQFLRHIESRLPFYRRHFEEAAAMTGIDWRLLAAMGYQESHWDPNAVSPTGVRGIMMLTRATARQLGIEDRTSPRDSILGGARYLVRIRKKIPARIPEPDRTWMALAAYNVGFGHLEDARILTQRDGGNPDSWADVRKRLPLLAQKRYYSTVKRGYARGREPVIYVANIRSYVDILKWKTSPQGRRLRPQRAPAADDDQRT